MYRYNFYPSNDGANWKFGIDPNCRARLNVHSSTAQFDLFASRKNFVGVSCL